MDLTLLCRLNIKYYIGHTFLETPDRIQTIFASECSIKLINIICRYINNSDFTNSLVS